MDASTTARDTTQRDWTLMTMVPDWTVVEAFQGVIEQLRLEERPGRLDDVRLERLSEGRCVQALHVGAYDDEAPLLRHLHEDLLPARGLAGVGRHHEIHLSDPRRVEPSRRRTILRQPVAEVRPHQGAGGGASG